MFSLVVGLAIAMTPQEALRPQYHFTAPKGWLNDPNGLVYYRGEYHLFYQHNPFSTAWGNMTWGHAVSKDLLAWKDLPHAIEPDATGTMFSGSAVVDWENTSGFGSWKNPPLVLLYTAAGGTNEASKGVPFTQGLAYSSDGRKFEKLLANPVVSHIEHENRDPKVVWHEPTKNWIMALYINEDRFALFRSPDLKTWTKIDDVRVAGASECPDFFELPLDSDRKKSKWVFWTANGRYLLGSFDGHKFKTDGEPIDSTFGANDYAAQTFSDEPKKRRIQISWMRGGNYPGMQFNQQMTLPRELLLKITSKGPRLSFRPMEELKKLRKAKVADLGKLQSDLLEIRGVFSRVEDASIDLGEQSIRYDSATRTMTCMGRSAKLVGDSEEVDLVVYLDRTSIEIFADGGFIQIANCFVPKARMESIRSSNIKKLEAWELRASMTR
jgi:fructan beta-fructosidase